MSSTRVRLPEDWLRFDKVGLFGAILFPLLLALLWMTGFGPSAYKSCFPKPTELSLMADAGKVTLSGRVASVADRTTLVEAARQAYGAGNVTDKLVVDAEAEPLGWVRNATAIVKRLKSVGQSAALKIVGGNAVVEGTVPTASAKETAARDLSTMLGVAVSLKDGIVVAAAQPVAPPPPTPKAEPVAPKAEPVAPKAEPVAPKPEAPKAVIAKGQLGAYRLPNGTEISILGEGLESKVLAFLEDASRPVDKGLWFDFDRLHFKTGSAELTPESRAQIDTLVAILKAYPNAAIKIGGYTDNVGDAGNNLKLSGARAERVAEQIATQGIAADRIEAEGYGEQHPIASNDTAEGRALNRRTALSVRRK